MTDESFIFGTILLIGLFLICLSVFLGLGLIPGLITAGFVLIAIGCCA